MKYDLRIKIYLAITFQMQLSKTSCSTAIVENNEIKYYTNFEAVRKKFE